MIMDIEEESFGIAYFSIKTKKDYVYKTKQLLFHFTNSLQMFCSGGTKLGYSRELPL